MNHWSKLLALVALCLIASPAEAGLRDRLGGRRGGGSGDCADGSCGRPIGFGLKRPGKEVGEVTGDGAIVKMYEAQPVEPAPEPVVPRVESGISPLLVLALGWPLCLIVPAIAGGGTYFVIRKVQESNDD